MQNRLAFALGTRAAGVRPFSFICQHHTHGGGATTQARDTHFVLVSTHLSKGGHRDGVGIDRLARAAIATSNDSRQIITLHAPLALFCRNEISLAPLPPMLNNSEPIIFMAPAPWLFVSSSLPPTIVIWETKAVLGKWNYNYYTPPWQLL
jgi:hypothetical protein